MDAPTSDLRKMEEARAQLDSSSIACSKQLKERTNLFMAGAITIGRSVSHARTTHVARLSHIPAASLASVFAESGAIRIISAHLKVTAQRVSWQLLGDFKPVVRSRGLPFYASTHVPIAHGHIGRTQGNHNILS